jgi:ribosomal protein S18 acetylase RimI-like enzyme
VIAVAERRGYALVAECGTPELDLSRPEPLAHLSEAARELRARARGWGLKLSSRPIELRFFPRRISVELVRGREVVATTAYGVWPEYVRQYGRRLHGLTSVQVAPGWRGKGLGKLIVIEAMEAAIGDGAEAVHLHVWRGNEPAWNLYHRALGFQPRYSWVTLEKTLGG